MARMKSITTIENEIAKTESELIKLQKKHDALAGKLRALQKEREDYEARQIMDAYKRSGKSLHGLMTFLGD